LLPALNNWLLKAQKQKITITRLVSANSAATIGIYSISEINRLGIQNRFDTILSIRWTFDADEYLILYPDLLPAILSYLYDYSTMLQIRVQAVTQFQHSTGRFFVDDGIIRGGIDNGEPSFLGE